MGHQMDCNPNTWHLPKCQCGFRGKVEKIVEIDDRYDDGVKDGMRYQVANVQRLQLLLRELAGEIFEINEGGDFINKGRSTLARRVSVEIIAPVRGDSYGPRIIPITQVGNELERANLMGIEAATVAVEETEIQCSAMVDEDVIEHHREQFLEAIRKLIEDKTE